MNLLNGPEIPGCITTGGSTWNLGRNPDSAYYLSDYFIRHPPDLTSLPSDPMTLTRAGFPPFVPNVLLVATALFGCQSTPQGIAPDAVVVTASDAGTRVHVAPGQEILVRLLANPATGYEWQLLALPNQAVLLPDGNRWVQSPAEVERQDEVKTQELRFVAQGPGETRVELEYLVPSQPGGAGDAQFSFEVLVKAP